VRALKRHCAADGVLAIVAVGGAGDDLAWIESFSTNPLTVGEEEIAIALELVIRSAHSAGCTRGRWCGGAICRVVRRGRPHPLALGHTAIATLVCNPMGPTFVLASFKRVDLMCVFHGTSRAERSEHWS